MAATKVMCECPKCGGTGYISAFAGIANGTCFRCAGSGKVVYRKSRAMVKPLTEYQQKYIDTIMTADLSGMTYAQLNDLRNFAHWPIKQCPELLSIWRERGDPYFFAAQEDRLAEMGYA